MEHGPQLHGVLLGVAAFGVLMGWVAYVVARRIKGKRRSDRDPATDQNPHPSDRSREP